LGRPKGRDSALYAYSKNVAADLTPKQTAQLAKIVKEEFRNESEDV
jgi:hypothetical protein